MTEIYSYQEGECTYYIFLFGISLYIAEEITDIFS